MYNSHQNPYLPDQNESTLELDPEDFSRNVIKAINGGKTQAVPVVTVLFSGRPRIVSTALNASNAFIAAWLPGTSGGEAIVQAIFGEYLFREGNSSANTLPCDWMASMASLENFPIYKSDGSVPKIKDPLFPMGYGLATTAKPEDAQ